MSASPPDLPGVTHRRVRAGQVELHVAEAGEGPPLVLLHGWPQHFYLWRHVIPLVAGERRVIAPDLRGLGWSDAPRSSYRKEELAGDLLALLDALGLDQVQLAGHDWGGFVGFLAALRAPERFSSFTALSILHPWVSMPVKPKMLPRVLYQVVVGTPVLGPLAQRTLPVTEAIRRLSRAPWSDEDAEIYAERFRDADRAEASSRLYRTFLLHERGEIHGGAYRGQRLTVPTRLVVGRRDPVIGPGIGRGAEDHADDLRVEWVDGTHWLPEEAPELVAERILGMPAPGSA